MQGDVALVTLDRPPVNALSAALTADLDEAVAKAEDPAVRAVVLTGSPHFAAGADISEFKAAMDGGGEDALANRLSEVVRRLETLPKPVIAAVRGYALGGGLEVAMGCDFRFLAEDATVGQPEIKLGIIPGAGGTIRLTRLIGPAKAKDLIYTGRFVGAAEALDLGIADRVVPADGLDEAAMEYAAALAAGPTVALGAARRAVTDGLGLPVPEALALETAGFDASFATDDAREGVAAFLEKREPGFSGR
ncbi:MAG: enoyl-CoA hydratase/isomerase family protein [Actinobacteria bacterium]|nr:enoyl-CoA hydratase/isomerase family protein [Actinomycetota bacterium]